MLINQKAKVATEEERFIDAFDQLDSITRQALMINLRAMAAGDSMREALNKALAFLSEHPGYDDIAQCWLDIANRWEAEHNA